MERYLVAAQQLPLGFRWPFSAMPPAAYRPIARYDAHVRQRFFVAWQCEKAGDNR